MFDEEKDQEGLELTVPLSMGDQEVVMDPQGHSYKQYHDETAGYTLQNQYTAAYQRWLAAEADHEEALGRFKHECQDAQVDWRIFLRKAKTQRKQQPEQNESESQQNSSGMPESVEVIPDDDDIYDDDELLRFVDVLMTLRENCNFAKDVMARIGNDIKELTKLEDERHKQQEEHKAAAAAAAAAAVADAPSGSSSAQRKHAKQNNKITMRQNSDGSNDINNQKNATKNSDAAVDDANYEIPMFPSDPFFSTNTGGQEECESPILANKTVTSSAYFDVKSSLNGDNNPDHGIEMSSSIYASAVQDAVPARLPISPVNNPTVVPSRSWIGEDETEEVQHDSNLENTTTTVPRRFRVAKPVANAANRIQVEWMGWENPFLRKNRNRVTDDDSGSM
jgi:hypothetical protein